MSATRFPFNAIHAAGYQAINCELDRQRQLERNTSSTPPAKTLYRAINPTPQSAETPADDADTSWQRFCELCEMHAPLIATMLDFATLGAIVTSFVQVASHRDTYHFVMTVLWVLASAWTTMFLVDVFRRRLDPLYSESGVNRTFAPAKMAIICIFNEIWCIAIGTVIIAIDNPRRDRATLWYNIVTIFAAMVLFAVFIVIRIKFLACMCSLPTPVPDAEFVTV